MSREVRIEFQHSRRPWRGKPRREWWFRLVAPENNKILCSSEGYARKTDCLKAAARIHNAVIVYDMTPPKG